MPFKLFVLICVLASTAACQEYMQSTPDTPTPAPTATEEDRSENYFEVMANGIRLGIGVPWGWKAHQTAGGLVMTEHYTSVQITGMEVHIFVHPVEGFDLPTGDANDALAVLKQILQKPDYLGKASASAPQGFEWDGHDAAYYLLNTGDGNVTMLLALMLQSPPQLVVCNISSPDERAQSIRVMLPNLLGSLTINGLSMDLEAVNELPNPLDFPDYEAQPESTVEAVNW